MAHLMTVIDHLFSKIVPPFPLLVSRKRFDREGYRCLSADSLSRCLGVAASFGPQCVLTTMPSHPLRISFTSSWLASLKRNPNGDAGRRKGPTRLIFAPRQVTLSPGLCKLGFDMHRCATALHLDHIFHVDKKNGRHALETYLKVLGGEIHLHKKAVLDTFMGAAFEPEICSITLPGSAQNLLLVPGIDTSVIELKHLIVLSRLVRTGDRLYALKPKRVKNDSHSSSRFNTRLRNPMKVVVTIKSPNGRNATVTVDRAFPSTAKSIPSSRWAENTYYRGRHTACAILVFSQRIFFPSDGKPRGGASRGSTSRKGPRFLRGPEVEPSQTKAVERILSDDVDDCVCVVHGPPGTGKTTVIAASFFDFKLLVSMDFHYDCCTRDRRNVIRSDDFTESIASQIDVGDYLPLLHLHRKHIQKLAFIGDDNQLAPYGQEDLGTLRSVFEVEQLRKNAVFLDTQYRMPEPIGNFISKHVYGGLLKTDHKVTARLSCRFVDVHFGEERRVGSSWQNVREADAVVHIARRLHTQGKSFRIITPYDPQRNLLEQRLKAAGLPWENKCFNVDSFQGNEEDHIIISVVRSAKIGFLKNLRRTNVMLSRCKKSMIICTSRAFLKNVASSTLIGKLAAEWEDDNAWLKWRDILNGRF
ncbi:AAA domain-containing protein [Amylocystis lapponica]|nr:AAA domain-containing protein [Amylocystis lapponica]